MPPQPPVPVPPPAGKCRFSVAGVAAAGLVGAQDGLGPVRGTRDPMTVRSPFLELRCLSAPGGGFPQKAGSPEGTCACGSLVPAKTGVAALLPDVCGLSLRLGDPASALGTAVGDTVRPPSCRGDSQTVTAATRRAHDGSLHGMKGDARDCLACDVVVTRRPQRPVSPGPVGSSLARRSDPSGVGCAETPTPPRATPQSRSESPRGPRPGRGYVLRTSRQLSSNRGPRARLVSVTSTLVNSAVSRTQPNC